MLRQGDARIDAKRRNVINPRRKQFAESLYKQQDYPYRLSFYEVPPTEEITLEQFEQWAIDRLRGKISEYHVEGLF
jgi:DNA primase large subunit